MTSQEVTKVNKDFKLLTETTYNNNDSERYQSKVRIFKQNIVKKINKFNEPTKEIQKKNKIDLKKTNGVVVW